MHRGEPARTASPLKNLRLINLLLQPFPLTSSHTCPFPSPTTLIIAISAPSPPRPAALERLLMNDTVTHVCFSDNPLLQCCPAAPSSPPRPGEISAQRLLSQRPSAERLVQPPAPSPPPPPPANEYFIVSSGQKVLGSAAARGLANDKLGFSPCRTGGVIMDRGSQSWISEIHGTCIA